jgi:hypothetical protein
MKLIVSAFLFAAGATFAATVVTAPPAVEGIPYRHTVTMRGTDSASVTRHVGAWSWEDDSLFDPGNGEPPVGWTHTSDWVALTLLEATEFTLRLERQEGVPSPTPQDINNIAGVTSMFPSFTLYSGWDTDGTQHHTFNNRGHPDWAGVTYLDHLDNSTRPFAERRWSLPAGKYSIILGSNAPATDTNRQGYLATFTTVPEPGAAALCVLALGLGLRRRRRTEGLPLRGARRRSEAVLMHPGPRDRSACSAVLSDRAVTKM